ncbi:MAG TPA: DPP IV N-terminal domain-containing protein, partial [Blastocatellia bacterium]|nr:DPP IV N-terminal domain-containing protein [Blastocatellia bacterium]
MKPKIATQASRIIAITFVFALGILPLTSGAQDRLKTMPGYERFQQMSGKIAGAVKPGTLTVKWIEGGKAFEYQKDGKNYRYDLAARKAVEAEPSSNAGPNAPNRFGGRAQGVERGRQAAFAMSPDGKLKAFYRDRNLWLSDAGGGNETAITTDGSEKTRTKYGVASWVYGEELSQTTAMWWSPDGKRIAYYRFDESPVKDYFLQLDQTQLQSKMDIEAYPKA